MEAPQRLLSEPEFSHRQAALPAATATAQPGPNPLLAARPRAGGGRTLELRLDIEGLASLGAEGGVEPGDALAVPGDVAARRAPRPLRDRRGGRPLLSGGLHLERLQPLDACPEHHREPRAIAAELVGEGR